MRQLLITVCLALTAFGSVPAQGAIKFVDSRQLWIFNSSVFSNQSTATIAFKVKIESANPRSIPRTVVLASTIDRFTFELWPSATKDTVELRAVFHGASGGFALGIIPIKIGVPYALVVTWDGPHKTQTMWVSGIPTVIGRVAGNTKTGTRPVFIGPDIGATKVVPILEDLCIWHGYAFTDADAMAYTNNVDASTLGAVAEQRFRWTLAGTVGSVATPADEGLKDMYGKGPKVYRIQEGGGAASYAEPIVWKPAVTATPYVAQSGKTIVLPLTSDIDKAPVAPSKVMRVPTLSVNGTNLGSLEKPWITGKHPLAFYATPGGHKISPHDDVTINAPVAWCTTSAGAVAGLNQQKVDNRSGKSSVGSDVVDHTLRIGINMNLAPTSPGLGFYWPFKNYKYRVGWPPANPGKVRGPATLPVANIAGNNGIDATAYPGPAGKWLVMWDAVDRANPASFELTTLTPATTKVVQHPELSVRGKSGIGRCRVADFQHASRSGSANIDVEVKISAGNYSNLWICAPGDWDIVNGQVVLDRSDPLALSRTYVDRLTPNVGSIRWVDSTACGGNPVSFPYPEWLPRVTDENWGDLSFRVNHFGFKTIGPVDVVTTPWIYSPQFRQPDHLFAATLDQPIATTPAAGTKESYTFSDADKAPLMAGLEITIDSEVMRIISVKGKSVVLNRGSNGTTPATHNAGVVAVNGRKSIRSLLNAEGGLPKGITYQLTTDRPHGITTGNGFNVNGIPPLTWSDGTTSEVLARFSAVTGPNTIFSWWGPTKSGGAVTLPRATALDPKKSYSEVRYNSAIPVEATAVATARFPHANLHVNIPSDACRDMVYEYARRVRNHFPAGRKVIVERSNEPWNWAFTSFSYMSVMGSLAMPGWPVTHKGQTNLLAYYVHLASDDRRIFRDVFAEKGRENEVMIMLNAQMGTDPALYLDVAKANGWTIDAIGIAPYLFTEATPYNAEVADTYDDEQLIDMFVHDLYFNPTTYNLWAKTARDGIARYNEATGNKCVLMAYEGGFEMIVPSPQPLTKPYHVERNHDIAYNPNWRIAEQDFYAWEQANGFTGANVYSLSQYWNPQGWGLYHGLLQDHGLGDGSDGKADNRLWRAHPKAASYKGPRVNQDQNCVSVRGEAFRNWLGMFGR